MRIDNNVKTGNVASRAGARGANGGPAFVVENGGGAPRAAAAGATIAATSIDALLALQAADDPLAERRKQVRRGRSLLDALDALKADLLAGRAGEGHLNQIMALIGQARAGGDPGLVGLLDDIELRARVELAKRGRYPA